MWPHLAHVSAGNGADGAVVDNYFGQKRAASVGEERLGAASKVWSNDSYIFLYTLKNYLSSYVRMWKSSQCPHLPAQNSYTQESGPIWSICMLSMGSLARAGIRVVQCLWSLCWMPSNTEKFWHMPPSARNSPGWPCDRTESWLGVPCRMPSATQVLSFRKLGPGWGRKEVGRERNSSKMSHMLCFRGFWSCLRAASPWTSEEGDSRLLCKRASNLDIEDLDSCPSLTAYWRSYLEQVITSLSHFLIHKAGVDVFNS